MNEWDFDLNRPCCASSVDLIWLFWSIYYNECPSWQLGNHPLILYTFSTSCLTSQPRLQRQIHQLLHYSSLTKQEEWTCEKSAGKLTMVSTCLRGRSLLGACSETTKRDRQWDQHLPIRFKLLTSWDVMLCHRVFTLCSEPFLALMWPGVE